MTGFVTFHQLAQAQFEPPGAPPRPPASADVRRRAPEARLFEGPPAKWWAVEVRFDRPLARRHVGVLVRQYGAYDPGYVNIGVDGMVWSQWYGKWPGPGDHEEIARLVERLGVPSVARAAPFGRDCPGGFACPLAGEEEHRCEVGTAYSGAPSFRQEDWIAIIPSRWRNE